MASRDTHTLPLTLLLLCLLPSLLLAEDGGTADVACDPDGTCNDLGGGKFDLTGSPDAPAAVVSSSYFLFGEFSASLKIQAGVSGTLVTSLVLSDDKKEKEKGHSAITLHLFGNKASNQTLMLTQVVSQKKHHSALFRLPWDAGKASHNYKVVWGKKSIFWIVDGKPLRQLFRNTDNPWPTHPLLPQVRVGETENVAQGDLPTPPKVTSSLAKFTCEGCLTDKDAPEDEGCQGSDSLELTWNRPLSAVQLKAYNSWHYTQLVETSLKWDKN